jgi:DNA-directed RNA polymerase alpha subunit
MRSEYRRLLIEIADLERRLERMRAVARLWHTRAPATLAEMRALADLFDDARVGHRARMSVYRANINTVEQLCDHTAAELLSIHDVGEITLARIELALLDRGLALRGEA